MDYRERVFAALEGKQPDRVPMFELVVDEHVIDAIVPGGDYYDFTEQLDLDAVSLNRSSWDLRNISFVDEAKRTFYDKWGVLRRLGPESVPYPVESPIQSPEGLKSYTPPDGSVPQALGHLPEVVERYKGKRPIVFLGRDCYFNPAHLRGVENFLMDIVLRPDFVRELIECCQDHDLAQLRQAIAAGAEIIVFGDDYADKNSPFMSPRHFEEIFLPYFKKAVDTAHEAGAYVIKHSDGNIEPIMDMMVSTGIDGLDPLEPAAGMSLATVRERYGNRLCLMGNVDCGPLLTWGCPEEVRETVKQCFRDGGRDGAYILASSNSIHSTVKPENYLAMVEVRDQFGTYPLAV
jgi:uroporphyrinogen decarboxylase